MIIKSSQLYNAHTVINILNSFSIELSQSVIFEITHGINNDHKGLKIKQLSTFCSITSSSGNKTCRLNCLSVYCQAFLFVVNSIRKHFKVDSKIETQNRLVFVVNVSTVIVIIAGRAQDILYDIQDIPFLIYVYTVDERLFLIFSAENS